MTTSPNILLIVADDHGYADQSALGVENDVATPGLDRLAALGVRCTSAYVAAPICSPSRSAILTGAYPQRWGSYWFDSARFPSGARTIAQQLQGAGYRTGYFGKVHYGETDDRFTESSPNHHGFEETIYSLAGKQIGRVHYLKHTGADAEAYGEAAAPMGVGPLLSGDDEFESSELTTRLFGRSAREFMGASEQPFFCYVAFNAVHNFCFQLPEDELRARGLDPHPDWKPDEIDYLDWYGGAIYPRLGDQGRAYYRAQLEIMDAEINAFIDHLEAAGQLENTIIVYLSDNGGGHETYASNAPLRGMKYSLFEGGVRVPFIVAWPAGGVPAGGEVDSLTSSMDLFPTFSEVVGLEPPADIDGVSQLHAWREIEDGTSHELLHWDNGFQWAIRDDRWKLHWVDATDSTAVALEKIEKVHVGEGLSLFDLAVDPGETTDLSAQHPEVVARLMQEHENWQAEMRQAAKNRVG